MADLRELARDLRAVQRGLRGAETRANLATAQGALYTARYFSAGTFPQRLFDTAVSKGGLGAPYGHGSTGWLGPRGPIPYGFPGVINRQSGVFQASWRISTKRAFGGSVVVLHNVASYAGFLEHGTRLMIARPIQIPINDFIDRAGPRNLLSEYEALLRRELNG